MWGAKEDEWSQRGFDFIRRQLAILVDNSPRRRAGFREDSGFNIELQSPDFRGGEGDLREQLIEASWGTLTARLDKSGKAFCRLESKDSAPQGISSSRTFNAIKGAFLCIGILPDRKIHFRDPAVMSQHVAAAVTENWGGVKVRFNGFRIYPYGDKNDDWLEIERDRARRLGKPDVSRDGGKLFDFAKSISQVDPGRVMLSLLSSNSYIGTVDVDSEKTRAVRGIR